MPPLQQDEEPDSFMGISTSVHYNTGTVQKILRRFGIYSEQKLGFCFQIITLNEAKLLDEFYSPNFLSRTVFVR